MGIVLGLDIMPLEIEPAEWECFYDKILEITRAFPLPVLRYGCERKFGYQRLLLSHNPESKDERGRYLAITGDAQTGLWGEQFIIYRDLHVYRQKLYRLINSPEKEEKQTSQVETNALANWPILLQEDKSVNVFFEKTQSRPYHDLIWSIVTLAENLFAGRACATGNLNAREWQGTLQWLKSVTGRRLKKPLLLDVERLWHAFGPAFTGLELVQKVTEKLVGGPAPLYRFLKRKDPLLLGDFAKARLSSCDSQTVGALSECLDVLDGTEDLRFLVEMGCLAPNGPRWNLVDVLSIAFRLGTFTPEKKAPHATRAIGFLPAEFLPEYYHTNLFVEKSSACQQMSEVTGLPEQKIEEMLLKIEEENTVDHIVNSTQLSDEYAAHATESASPCPEQLEIPYPEEMKNSLKEQVVTAGKNWDSSTLHRLVVGIASERNIVLTEESWNIVDEEKDPDLLVFTLALISNYQGTKGQLRVIEHILKHLKEAKHAWENGCSWVCNNQ